MAGMREKKGDRGGSQAMKQAPHVIKMLLNSPGIDPFLEDKANADRVFYPRKV